MTPYDSYLAKHAGAWGAFASWAPGALDRGFRGLDNLATVARSGENVARAAKRVWPRVAEGGQNLLHDLKGAVGLRKRTPKWVKPVAIGAGSAAVGGMALSAMGNQQGY